MQEVWISRYALSSGLFKRRGNVRGDDMFTSENIILFSDWFNKGEWHLTKEEAILKADEMRKKKIESLKIEIKSLKESIKKLEKMVF